MQLLLAKNNQGFLLDQGPHGQKMNPFDKKRLVLGESALKGKFTQKESWSEMNEPTKTRRTPLTVCKYLV